MFDLFADKYRTASSRLQNWDYSTPGTYFITICTYLHNNFFGKIENNKMYLSPHGTIAQNCLIDIPKHFLTIRLLEFVVMPNHVHLLVCVTSPLSNCVETHHDASLPKGYNNYFHHRIAKRSTQTIPLVIKQYKSAVTRLINPRTMFFGWQSRFYDEIVDNNKRLKLVKDYIINNPKNWQKDKLYQE